MKRTGRGRQAQLSSAARSRYPLAELQYQEAQIGKSNLGSYLYAGIPDYW